MRQPADKLAISWVRNETTLYGTSENGSCRLIVEALPRRAAWDWAVWRSSPDPTPRFGRAPSADIAISDAERAARDLAVSAMSPSREQGPATRHAVAPGDRLFRAIVRTG
jgi:hypothetical protein